MYVGWASSSQDTISAIYSHAVQSLRNFGGAPLRLPAEQHSGFAPFGRHLAILDTPRVK
jgi:hypothetical protein